MTGVETAAAHIHASARVLSRGRRTGRAGVGSAATLALLAACALAGGCARHDAPSAPAQPASALDADSASGAARYLAPPSVVDVAPEAGGALTVSGRATPGSQVQLASPDGTLARMQADAKGVWRLRLDPAAAPRLFAVSSMAQGRTLHAEGALLLTPGALAPAVTLRAGAAALPLGATVQGRLALATVDYDPAGFLAVAGEAPPQANVALAIDGAAAASGQADGAGRYALLAAGRRLGMGPHRLTVATQGQTANREVVLMTPASLTTPFSATRTADGWRVEWALTGGGVQTTLALAPS